MLASLSLIILVGISTAFIFKKIKLPRIIGMILAGIIIGPYVLNFLEPSILNISADLREIALIIILLRAGLSLDINDLKKVGRPSILLSFIPAVFEILGFVVFGPILLKISIIDSLILGAIIAAVSPAVVVPRMVDYIETGYGTKKSIPQMIIAASSSDDIFVIVLFTSFLNIAKEGQVSFTSFLNIPISIFLGVVIGMILGYLLYVFFQSFSQHHSSIRNSTKLIILLAFAFGMVAIEERLNGLIAFSALLATISMASMLKHKIKLETSHVLSERYGKLWLFAEIVLFVLVGASVDIRYTLEIGLVGILLIILALVFRSVGVFVSLIKTGLNFKEKLFCVIAFLPKATVQAAIGSIPLAAGLASGKVILSIAVLSILLTAPLGAISLDYTYKKLLTNDKLLKTEK